MGYMHSSLDTCFWRFRGHAPSTLCTLPLCFCPKHDFQNKESCTSPRFFDILKLPSTFPLDSRSRPHCVMPSSVFCILTFHSCCTYTPSSPVCAVPRPSARAPLPHKYYTCHDLLYVHPFLTSPTSATACCTYTPSSQMPPIWNNTKRPTKHLHNQESKGTHEAPNHRYSLTPTTDMNMIPGRDLENITRHTDVSRQRKEHISTHITSAHRNSYWWTHPNRRK